MYHVLSYPGRRRTIKYVCMYVQYEQILLKTDTLGILEREEKGGRVSCFMERWNSAKLSQAPHRAFSEGAVALLPQRHESADLTVNRMHSMFSALNPDIHCFYDLCLKMFKPTSLSFQQTKNYLCSSRDSWNNATDLISNKALDHKYRVHI